MEDSISPLELYINYKPSSVINTREISDKACGIYPCYYRFTESGLKVSTSAVSLMIDSGQYERNEEYIIQEFIKNFGGNDTQSRIENLGSRLPHWFTSRIPSSFVDLLKDKSLLPERHWDEQIETLDKNVYRLQPFETVAEDGTRTQNVEFDRNLSQKNRFIQLSSQYITKFVHKIEQRFPNYEHIVLTGGKDSLLIHLVPKLTDNWSAFSAYPNYENTQEFLDKNDISVNNLFTHSNTNQETRGDTVKKAICSDLRADPRHIRWRLKLAKISNKLDHKCIFWAGTEGDTINSYYSEFHDENEQGYFELQMSRAANWQGTTHQTTANFTGSPMLSLYHSPELWQEVYRRYDPEMIKEGDDLRDEIGQQLAGRPVTWPSTNPGPSPYRYSDGFDLEQAYEEFIQKYCHREKKPLLYELNSAELEALI